MTKKHLKRLNAPKTWDIERKKNKYIRRPNPGAHCFNNGLPLSVVLRDILGVANTEREIRNVLNKSEIFIDCLRRKDPKFIVGLMDIVSIPSLNENFRVIFNSKGKIDAIKIDDRESKLKICKINGKKMHKKGLQINLLDGRNIIIDKKDCKVGDSVLIELPSQNIKEIIKIDRGALAILIGGKNIGTITHIEEIKEDVIKCRTKDTVFETAKKYAFVVGKEKPLIKISE